MVIGLISDTHGLLRPEAIKALRGSRLIIHAGDIGAPDILRELERIAPVYAVRGNNDRERWAHSLPITNSVEVEGLRIFVIHNVHEIKIDPQKEGYGIVVFGHSHRPVVEQRKGVLFVNPGSAGPRRFRLPVAVGKLNVGFRRADAEILTLSV
jgi:putative phosphoesterase